MERTIKKQIELLKGLFTDEEYTLLKKYYTDDNASNPYQIALNLGLPKVDRNYAEYGVTEVSRMHTEYVTICKILTSINTKLHTAYKLAKFSSEILKKFNTEKSNVFNVKRKFEDEIRNASTISLNILKTYGAENLSEKSKSLILAKHKLITRHEDLYKHIKNTELEIKNIIEGEMV